MKNIDRITARVALIDENDRILLIKQHDDRTNYPTFWTTPGGGLLEGETHRQAAMRELYEEVGLLRVDLVGPIWHNRKVFRFGTDLLKMDETFYVSNALSCNVSLYHRPLGEEGKRWLETRWWTVAELGFTDEIVFPERLGFLLRMLWRDGYPSNPIDLADWFAECPL
jgi:8-oxo-dGTP pyrophosphatase MutT (NUDIX family)